MRGFGLPRAAASYPIELLAERQIITSVKEMQNLVRRGKVLRWMVIINTPWAVKNATYTLLTALMIGAALGIQAAVGPRPAKIGCNSKRRGKAS